MDVFALSRSWFDWCFENPEKVSPSHTAIYFFAIEHCNRLGWKEKFGFPTQMTMDAIGISKHQTYMKYFNDLVEWGFLKLVQKSQNQYSSNIISLVSAIPKNGKALSRAAAKHGAKQLTSTGQSKHESDGSIDILINQEPINQEQVLPHGFGFKKVWCEWVKYRKEIKKPLTETSIKKQIEFLAAKSETDAIATLNKSMMNSWQGMAFDEKKQSNNATKKQSRSAGVQGAINDLEEYLNTCTAQDV